MHSKLLEHWKNLDWKELEESNSNKKLLEASKNITANRILTNRKKLSPSDAKITILTFLV